MFDSIGHIGITTILMLIIPYFIPSIIAFSKKHYNATGVLLLNLFLGWTLIGWIAALIWSFSNAYGTQVINISSPATQEQHFKPESIVPSQPTRVDVESPTKNFCSKCGTPIKSADSFCSKCGMKLA